LDADSDDDGVTDDLDEYPLDETEQRDTDGDGTPDNQDTDDDGDGIVDDDDAFPLDATESIDTDGDGIGNNADEDDDGDGVNDIQLVVDLGLVGSGQVTLTFDAFPLDPQEQYDTDNDGVGNNADNDDDNDGIEDALDAFPLNPNENLDTDGDGIGDTTDLDDDGDGYPDSVEIQGGSDPLDAFSQPSDKDQDGLADFIDTDDNGDGFNDNEIFISEVLTPTIDGPEATWEVINLVNYPNSMVRIYNRNGRLVFEKRNYQNDWGGVYEKTGELLPVGSYYFRIDLGDGSPIKDGWIYLSY